MPKIKTELSESEIISINAELNKQNLLLNEIKESHFRKIDTTKNLLNRITKVASNDFEYAFYFSQNKVIILKIFKSFVYLKNFHLVL